MEEGAQKIRIWNVLLSATVAGLLLFSMSSSAETHPKTDITKQLMAGNRRFRVHKLNPQKTQARRKKVAKGQHTVAAVLSFADSRVPPELVFDEGLGDLFTVRVAGNIVNLIIVMGHTGCGYVKAAVAGKPTHTHINHLIEAIKPAVEKAKKQEGDLTANAEIENVKQSMEALKHDESILAEHLKSGKLKIIGTIYDLKTGKIKMVE